MRYKAIKILSLPRSVARQLYNLHKTDDFPFTVFIRPYKITLWTYDLPVEVSYMG